MRTLIFALIAVSLIGTAVAQVRMFSGAPIPGGGGGGCDGSINAANGCPLPMLGVL